MGDRKKKVNDDVVDSAQRVLDYQTDGYTECQSAL
jgi:hypothetical protein